MQRSRRISDLWSTSAMRKRTFVACGVQIFTQCTGINGCVPFILSDKVSLHGYPVLGYYGPQMYRSLGISGSKELLVQGYVRSLSTRYNELNQLRRIYGAVGPITNLLCVHKLAIPTLY